MKPTRDDLLDRAMAMALADHNQGLCIACGAEHDGLEPDARKRTCESCGEPAVYGAEEIVIRLGF